jgi:methionine biosynthesis protein MetW
MSTHDSHELAAVRPDFAAIAAWIPEGASVLDLGCGDGSLLRFLRDTRKVRGYGVEISDANIVACINNNVNVIQGDLDAGLADFESDAFDFVVLSQTLQTIRHTEPLIQEMLRVGREGIVSFPNFGYWHSRFNVLKGNMPVSEVLPYEWHNTPNVHLCTIEDFEHFCNKYRVAVTARRVMSGKREISLLPNLLGSTAVYRLQRGS